MKKRLLSAILVAVMLMVQMPLMAFAETFEPGFDADGKIVLDLTGNEGAAFVEYLNSNAANPIWTKKSGANITHAANQGVTINKNGSTAYTFSLNLSTAGVTQNDSIYVETSWERGSGAGQWDWDFLGISEAYLPLDFGVGFQIGKYASAAGAETFYEKPSPGHNWTVQTFIDYQAQKFKVRAIYTNDPTVVREFECSMAIAAPSTIFWGSNGGMVVKNIKVTKNPQSEDMFKDIFAEEDEEDNEETVASEWEFDSDGKIEMDLKGNTGAAFVEYLASDPVNPIWTKNSAANITHTANQGVTINKNGSTAYTFSLNLSTAGVTQNDSVYVETSWERGSGAGQWDWDFLTVGSEIYLPLDRGVGFLIGKYATATGTETLYESPSPGHNWTIQTFIDYQAQKFKVRAIYTNDPTVVREFECSMAIGNPEKITWASNGGMVVKNIKVIKNPQSEDMFKDIIDNDNGNDDEDDDDAESDDASSFKGYEQNFNLELGAEWTGTAETTGGALDIRGGLSKTLDLKALGLSSKKIYKITYDFKMPVMENTSEANPNLVTRINGTMVSYNLPEREHSKIIYANDKYTSLSLDGDNWAGEHTIIWRPADGTVAVGLNGNIATTVQKNEFKGVNKFDLSGSKNDVFRAYVDNLKIEEVDTMDGLKYSTIVQGHIDETAKDKPAIVSYFNENNKAKVVVIPQGFDTYLESQFSLTKYNAVRSVIGVYDAVETMMPLIAPVYLYENGDVECQELYSKQAENIIIEKEYLSPQTVNVDLVAGDSEIVSIVVFDENNTFEGLSAITEVKEDYIKYFDMQRADRNGMVSFEINGLEEGSYTLYAFGESAESFTKVPISISSVTEAEYQDVLNEIYQASDKKAEIEANLDELGFDGELYSADALTLYVQSFADGMKEKTYSQNISDFELCGFVSAINSEADIDYVSYVKMLFAKDEVLTAFNKYIDTSERKEIFKKYLLKNKINVSARTMMTGELKNNIEEAVILTVTKSQKTGSYDIHDIMNVYLTKFTQISALSTNLYRKCIVNIWNSTFIGEAWMEFYSYDMADDWCCRNDNVPDFCKAVGQND